MAAVACTAAAGEQVFEPADILQWSHHSFTGETTYRLVEKDGAPAVQAICEQGTASGLFFRGGIDLTETPILEWRWRVEEVLEGVDETRRAGDDYPARLYVVDEHTLLRWRTRALNYVWSSAMPEGADWPNAYAEQARMIAVRSGAGEDGWVMERRNVQKDFRRYHDREVDTVDALAIMTDCDDTGQRTEAWYGPVRWLAE